MENGPFIDGLPGFYLLKNGDFSMAMLDNQKVPFKLFFFYQQDSLKLRVESRDLLICRPMWVTYKAES